MLIVQLCEITKLNNQFSQQSLWQTQTHLNSGASHPQWAELQVEWRSLVEPLINLKLMSKLWLGLFISNVLLKEMY